MVFPIAELKFAVILRTASRTRVLVRLYRIDDGGIVNGLQQYVRTLKRERLLRLDAGWDDARLLATGRIKLAEYLIEEGFNVPVEQQICTL